jgi:hypothetical protein
MTALGIFLLIAGWTLVYVGFTEPGGDIRKEIQAALGGSGPVRQPSRFPTPTGRPRGTIGPGV